MKKKATVITATALSIPLLVGCGQADTEATANPTDGSSEASSPASQTAQASGAETAPQSTESAAPSADPASTATGEQSDGAEQLPAVTDPCAGQCTETARIPVDHPKFGAMEVVTYHEVTSAPGAAPSTGEGSYALYQDGRPVGFVPSADGVGVVTFGQEPKLPGQTWDLANGSNVDKHGNVFLSYGDGVTVLTPTEKGYDSNGSMPPAEGEKAPFSNSGLKIDANGEATIIQKKVDENGTDTGETVEYTWDGSGFTAKS